MLQHSHTRRTRRCILYSGCMRSFGLWIDTELSSLRHRLSVATQTHNDAEGGNMTKDRTALLAIATRIAETENRVSQLRERVERLKTEGSDASQAQETLQIVSRNLANLYVQQSVMRQTVWAWHSSKAG